MGAADPSAPLDLASLRDAYARGEASPTAVIERVLASIEREAAPGIWTHRCDPAALLDEARALERGFVQGARPPLYGVPFAVKDSLDIAGIPTTAACPDFAYLPTRTAPVIERLRAAGALLVGKTNLDQFATGLVGVRSPYGVPPNPFDARHVTGGSSSGSAAAVARGQVTFSVATDTAGSGRVPAAFNNIVGLKPSRGVLSTTGLVPACRSIDCVTLLSLTCEDARAVAAIAAGYDAEDPFSRPEAARFSWRGATKGERPRRVGVPRPEDLVFGEDAARRAFERACKGLSETGFAVESVSLEPLLEAGGLLYDGPWLAERLAGMETFLREHPESVLPVIRTIVGGGERVRGTDAFRGAQRLAELKRAVEPLWARLDALVVPSAPMHPRIADVLADPIALNVRLGRYTTFANLLDLAGVAVPAPFREDGLPSGVTFLGPWGSDGALLSMAGALHVWADVPLGATGWPLPAGESDAVAVAGPDPSRFEVAVVGAHLEGLPLNHQLTDRGGRLVRTARTAPHYRLYALPGTVPPKPGLVRVGPGGEGAAIQVEVWSIPIESAGSFVAGVASPLAIGTIELVDGARVHGFLCESWAVEGARDITSFGGWRAYLRRDG
jgi:allophanate hydrolase